MATAGQKLRAGVRPLPTLKHATSATTRNTLSLMHLARQSAYLLVPQQIVMSPESRLQYRIERLELAVDTDTARRQIDLRRFAQQATTLDRRLQRRP